MGFPSKQQWWKCCWIFYILYQLFPKNQLHNKFVMYIYMMHIIIIYISILHFCIVWIINSHMNIFVSVKLFEIVFSLCVSQMQFYVFKVLNSQYTNVNFYFDVNLLIAFWHSFASCDVMETYLLSCGKASISLPLYESRWIQMGARHTREDQGDFTRDNSVLVRRILQKDAVRCYKILVVPWYWPKATQWGRVTHIYISKLTIIGSDNGLSPDQC